VICWSYGKNVKIAKICEYCKNGFCEIHKEPFRRKDFELLKKRYGDKAPEIPMKIEGHRCVEYDEFMDGEEKRILDEALESLNRLKNIIHIPKSSKPIISVGRRKQHKITVQTKQKRFQIWKLVAIVIAILLGIYFYSNPDKLNIIVQTISNLSNNLLKLISSVLWTTTANTTTTTQITPPTTTVKTMKCCCMVSCDRGSDCGWLENCFSVYKECPSSYCVK
jgi:hypothetical protein